MRTTRTEISRQLLSDIAAYRQRAGELRRRSTAELLHRPAPDRWSAAACIDHLNRTYGLYLARLSKAMQQQVHSGQNYFRSSWIGDFMVSSQQPRADGSIGYKMKTFRSLEPETDPADPHRVVDIYLANLEKLDGLIRQAAELDWNRIRVKSALGSLLRFRLGDAFRFLLAHDARHLRQAEKALPQPRRES